MNRIFGENIYAENLQYSAQTLVDFESLIENGHNHVNADGDPDLGFYGVFAEAVESSDAKDLLNPFEEELDLPARFVDLRDHNGVDLEVAGNEDQEPSGFSIQKIYSALVARVETFGFRAFKTNCLIGSQTDGFVYRTRSASGKRSLMLESGTILNYIKIKTCSFARRNRSSLLVPIFSLSDV